MVSINTALSSGSAGGPGLAGCPRAGLGAWLQWGARAARGSAGWMSPQIPGAAFAPRR